MLADGRNQCQIAGAEKSYSEDWSSLVPRLTVGILASMNQPGEIKVLIVNEEGQYLAGTATNWGFTEERTRARVFDFCQDHVPEMLSLVKNAHGIVWIAVKLDTCEAYEFCDRCGSRMTALLAFFNGVEFLCEACRDETSCRGRDVLLAVVAEPVG